MDLMKFQIQASETIALPYAFVMEIISVDTSLITLMIGAFNPCPSAITSNSSSGTLRKYCSMSLKLFEKLSF